MLSYTNGQRSTAMELPMAIPYGGMVLAFVFMLLHTIAVLVNLVDGLLPAPTDPMTEE